MSHVTRVKGCVTSLIQMGVSVSCGFWDLVESFVQDRVYIGRMEPSVRFGGWGGGGSGRINLTYTLYHVEFNYRMNLVPVT
jgi:hypothetical protein